MKKIELFEIANDKIKDYHFLFHNFGHFENLIGYILKYEKHSILVDDVMNPSYALLKYGPAIIVKGNPTLIDTSAIFKHFHAYNWIVPSSTAWDKYISDYFERRLEAHKRVLFDPSTLDLDHIRSLKKVLPTGMRFETISKTHIEDVEGIVYQDLIRKFYVNHDFLKTGRGIVLLDGEFIVGYAASDNPIIGNNLELMFRVGYDNFTKYRGKGYGISLCIEFIEDCLNNDFIPSWDAANEISAHIAQKLGYKQIKDWTMFKIL